ncbi:MAG: serine/threonine-protein kinase [Fuerstiella sp.]
MSYRYQNGDRPLDGYTIQYALGRGGFGEVYFAVSDSGREVALKAVQNYEEVELRGIGHCMNLKSPHLVMIFDVKHAPDGTPWVIMEYVSGPSLRDILDEAPTGLDIDQVRFFMRELCKGLSYLHEAGVVHRDLKPHNVFFEDGIVKIGDYSLSKVITNSHRSGNTMTVGSVHYMAPEISMGRYDKTVDIYALGCMLFEMITGKPPHVGESMGEVLMKHLSQEPNIAQLSEPFAAAVSKAMQREPSDRFTNAHEFALAIQEADTPSLTDTFHPATLSLAGQRARTSRQRADIKKQAAPRNFNQSPPPIPPASLLAASLPPGPISAGNHPDSPAAVLDQSPPFGITDSTSPTMHGDTGNLPYRASKPKLETKIRKASLGQKIGLRFTPLQRKSAAQDQLTLGWKLVLLIALAIIGTYSLALMTPTARYQGIILRGWLTIVAGGIGTILSLSDPIQKSGYFWGRLSRLAFAIMGGSAGAILVDLGAIGRGLDEEMIVAFIAGFCVPDWRCFIAPDRRRRIVIPATLFAGACTSVFMILSDGRLDIAATAGGTVMLFALAMQVTAPFRKSYAEAHEPVDRETHHPKTKPKLALDRTSILLEAIFLAAAVIVTGFIIDGSDDLLASAIPIGLAGLYALYLRLQRRIQPDGRVGKIAATVLLDLLSVVSAGICLAFVSQFDDDVIPGIAIFGSLAVWFGRLRYFKIQRARRERNGNFRINKLTAFFELVGLLATSIALSLTPWFSRYNDYIIGALAATAVAILAFRIRMSRNLFHSTSGQENKS